MYSVVYITCVFWGLLVLCTCGAHSHTTGTKCVSDFLEFEQKTFINNTENRYKLYKIFYPPNGHLPFSVDVSYQSVLSNGTTVIILTHRDGHMNKDWIWLSSPVFLLCKPVYWNRLIMYVLNYYKECETPDTQLNVPHPCPNVTFEFLLQITTSVS